MLRDRYLLFISDNYPEYYNPDHATQKLKEKMIKHFGDCIQFWLPQASCMTKLVYSSGVDLGEAVEASCLILLAQTQAF